MSVTLKNIAERVGRSVTTVSRALAGYDDVSEATRRQVQQVAREMGYVPNITARQLQKQRTDTIAFVMPTYGPRFSDPFFSEFLAGVGNQAAKFGFDLLVSTRPPGEEEIATYLKNIRSRRVDGFIIVRTRRCDDRITLLQNNNFPFVAFGRVEKNNEFPFVDENSEWGIKLMVDHLVEQGHTRLACIAPPSELMLAYYRRRGFVQGLQSHNLPVNERFILEADLTQQGGRQAAETLLSMPRPPSAIVACNDLMALGAMSAAHQRGLTVGRDISITGFDDIPLAEHANPPLTTVHQPVYQIGTMVSEMLINIIQGKTLPDQHVILQPSLIIRQSSRAKL